MNIEIHELISWGVTTISVTALLIEMKKDKSKSTYEVLQGLLRALKIKREFHGSRQGYLMNIDPRQITIHDYIQYAHSVSSEYESMMEHVLGYMKSLDPATKEKIDADSFTGGNSKYFKGLEEQKKALELQNDIKRLKIETIEQSPPLTGEENLEHNKALERNAKSPHSPHPSL